MSFAEALKKDKNKNQKRVLPEIRKEVPLLIKPKTKQNSNQTKNDLNEKVDPRELKISNIQAKSNGTIIIESENDNERNKIKSCDVGIK